MMHKELYSEPKSSRSLSKQMISSQKHGNFCLLSLRKFTTCRIRLEKLLELSESFWKALN